jgi:hypothetical protein
VRTSRNGTRRKGKVVRGKFVLAPVADMTLMFDNSRTADKVFALMRAQRKNRVLFNCRDPQYILDRSLRPVARPWLEKVSGPYKG